MMCRFKVYKGTEMPVSAKREAEIRQTLKNTNISKLEKYFLNNLTSEDELQIAIDCVERLNENTKDNTDGIHLLCAVVRNAFDKKNKKKFSTEIYYKAILEKLKTPAGICYLACLIPTNDEMNALTEATLKKLKLQAKKVLDEINTNPEKIWEYTDKNGKKLTQDNKDERRKDFIAALEKITNTETDKAASLFFEIFNGGFESFTDYAIIRANAKPPVASNKPNTPTAEGIEAKKTDAQKYEDEALKIKSEIITSEANFLNPIKEMIAFYDNFDYTSKKINNDVKEKLLKFLEPYRKITLLKSPLIPTELKNTTNAIETLTLLNKAFEDETNRYNKNEECFSRLTEQCNDQLADLCKLISDNNLDEITNFSGTFRVESQSIFVQLHER
jgi:hypothetical protein